MVKQGDKFNISHRSWYAWQMLPGYMGQLYLPYCSPILVEDVAPQKTGKGILTLSFMNLLYAEGVQDFTLDLKVLKHSKDYLIAEILYGPEEAERVAIISHIEYDWIERFCPELWNHHPPSLINKETPDSLSLYLNGVVGLRKSTDAVT